jgi:hypothetical protein
MTIVGPLPWGSSGHDRSKNPVNNHEIGNVPGRHSGDPEGFGVGTREPASELPQVVDYRPATVGSEVVRAQVSRNKGCLFRANRTSPQNIIVRILHVLSPRIGHEVDTENP